MHHDRQLVSMPVLLVTGSSLAAPIAPPRRPTWQAACCHCSALCPPPCLPFITAYGGPMQRAIHPSCPPQAHLGGPSAPPSRRGDFKARMEVWGLLRLALSAARVALSPAGVAKVVDGAFLGLAMRGCVLRVFKLGLHTVYTSGRDGCAPFNCWPPWAASCCVHARACAPCPHLPPSLAPMRITMLPRTCPQPGCCAPAAPPCLAAPTPCVRATRSRSRAARPRARGCVLRACVHACVLRVRACARLCVRVRT